MHVFRRIIVGLSRHPARTVAEAAGVYIVLWSLADPARELLQLSFSGWRPYAVLTAVSVLVGVLRAMPRQHVRRRIGASGTQVTVKFGDLFAEKGVRAVPVNEFFDSVLGAHVSPNSLHGKLLLEQFGAAPEEFESLVDQQLKTVTHETVNRSPGRSRRYPVGTTATVQTNSGHYLTFVLSHTDVQTLKASATTADLWEALSGLWQAARNTCGGKPLVVPLVGGGLSGVGLPAQHILSVLLISAIEETKRRQICSEFVFVVPPELFTDVDVSAAIDLVV